jgi:hypothetical protein
LVEARPRRRFGNRGILEPMRARQFDRPVPRNTGEGGVHHRDPACDRFETTAAVDPPAERALDAYGLRSFARRWVRT